MILFKIHSFIGKLILLLIIQIYKKKTGYFEFSLIYQSESAIILRILPESIRHLSYTKNFKTLRVIDF